jgi:hypothetical protein
MAEKRIQKASQKYRKPSKMKLMTAIGRVMALAVRRRKMLDLIDVRPKFDRQLAPVGNIGLVVTSHKAVGKNKVTWWLPHWEFDSTLSP